MTRFPQISFVFLLASAAVANADSRAIKCISTSDFHTPREILIETERDISRVLLSMDTGASLVAERELVYASPAGMNAPLGFNTQFFVINDFYVDSDGRSQIFIAVDWAAVKASMAFVNMVGLLSVDDKFNCRRLD